MKDEKFYTTSNPRNQRREKLVKNIFPIFIENSRIPVWLSYLAPININAISFFIFVWSRSTMSETTKRHETIHFKQQLEMLFVFQWILYGYFHLRGLLLGLKGSDAYYQNPFELEAYDNESNENYLSERKLYAWVKYGRRNKTGEG